MLSLRTHSRELLRALPPYALFLWYMAFGGMSTVLPRYYDAGDDMLYVIMLMSVSASGYIWKRLRVSRTIGLFALVLYLPILLSSICNLSSSALAFKYAYGISRPFVAVLYLIALRVDIIYLYGLILKTCRVILLANLPWLVKNLVVVNVNLFQPQYNDLIVGFFPFTNSDQLTTVYIVVLCSHFHRYFFLKSRRPSDVLWVGMCLALVFSTVNMKSILITVSGLVFLLVARLGAKGIIFCCLTAGVAIVFQGFFILLARYAGNMTLAPIVIVILLMFSGKIEGYNRLIGAGPGMFGSGVAISAHTPLAEKYLTPIQEWFWNMYHTIGSLGRTSSSFSAALGDTGIVGATLFSVLLSFFIVRLLRRVEVHEVFLLGFIVGINATFLGLVLNSWSWGGEVFLMMVAIAYTRRADVKGIQMVGRLGAESPAV